MRHRCSFISCSFLRMIYLFTQVTFYFVLFMTLMLCCTYKDVKCRKIPTHSTQNIVNVLLSASYELWAVSIYCDVIMVAIASQITSLTIVYLIVYSDADQRKHHNSASLAFVWGIHLGSVNSPHKWPVMRNMFPFDDVIMSEEISHVIIGFDNCVDCNMEY